MADFPPPDLDAAVKRPTIQTHDAKGYVYDTTSPEWKIACAPLPSCEALQWPGYATVCVPDVINGVEVIIQPWMGYCEQFFGRAKFPGGMGGEVAVYVKVPRGRALPDMSILPAPARVMLEGAALAGGDKLFWADASVQPEIDFTIINPVTNTVLLRADLETNYWVNKWMEPASYDRYKADVNHQVPSSPTLYKMVYTVAGRTREWLGAPFLGNV